LILAEENFFVFEMHWPDQGGGQTLQCMQEIGA